MRKKIYQYAILFAFLLVLFLNPSASDRDAVSAQTSFTGFIPFYSHYQSPYYLNGLDGGTIEGIVIDPNDSQVLYAGSWGNGIYKSTDGGDTWVNKNNGLQSPYIYEIAIDPQDSQHILVSVYEHGINQSVDGGESWTSANTGIPDGSVVYSIDFHPTDSSIIYAALRKPTIYVEGVPDYPGGVYKSSNGGSKWVEKSYGMTNDYVYDLGIDPNDPNTIYAAMHDTGVYKTTNGGNKWVAKLNWLIHKDIRSVDINPNTSRVYIGHWDGYGFSYSDNGGDSWVSVVSSNQSDLSIYEILIDPNKLNTVYLATYSGLYRCENPNHDSTCELIAHDDVLVFDLAIDHKSGVDASTGFTKRLYTGLQHCAIHKSEDAGQTFDPIYEGIRANIINSLIINPNYPNIQYVSVYGRGIFKSEDNGTTWFPLRGFTNGRFTNEIAFRPGRCYVIYVAADHGGIYWSTDAGNTWFDASTSMTLLLNAQDITNEPDRQSDFGSSMIYGWMDPIDQEEMLNVDNMNAAMASSITPDYTTLSFKPDDNKLSQMIAGTSNNGIKLSDDFGRTWFGALLTSKPIYDSMSDISQAPYLYFIGMKDDGVMCAKEDRISWIPRNEGFHESVDVFSLELVDSGFYYAGTDSGIYRTTNGGLEWEFIGLIGKQINDIIVDSKLTSTIWVATSEGLYKSVDAGAHWRKRPVNGLFNQNLIMLTQIPGGNDLYIGTDGGDMLRWTD